MTDTALHIEPGNLRKRRRPFPLRIVRFFAFLGLSFLLFLILLIAFTETPLFRSIAKDFLISTVDSTLYAKLELGDMSGNIFSGWKIDDVRLKNRSGTILELKSIVLRYNLFTVPWKRIEIAEVTLNQPLIYLNKAEGRDWNIAHLLRDTTETEPGSEFDWRIIAQSVRIVDGHLLIRDSTSQLPTLANRLNASDLNFDKINIALAADYGPDVKKLSLNQFRFDNVNGFVGVENISGDVILTNHSTEINNLSIQTKHSRFLVSGKVDSISMLKDFEFDKFVVAPLQFELTGPAVDMADLQYFLPALNFLGTTPSVDLRAKGSMKDLIIEELNVSTLNSRISFSGRLRNIDSGVDIKIDVESDDSRIEGADLPLVLPGFPLPDYSQVGLAQFRKLTFHGRPLRFSSEVDMDSDAGGITGLAEMDITGKELAYKTDLITRKLNLSKLFCQPRLSSELNMHLVLQGAGTDLGSMVADAQIVADSSRYQRYLTTTLAVTLKVRRDSLDLELNTSFGKSKLSVAGVMSFGIDTVTGFRVHATAQALDLAKALNDDSLSSDLTFTFDAKGNSLSLSEGSGAVSIAFEPSTFRDLVIDEDTLELVLSQKDKLARELLLRSQYADVKMEGQFDIPRFTTYLGAQVDSLTTALKRFDLLARTDHSRAWNTTPTNHGRKGETLKSATDSSDFMNARYSILLKRPDRFARYFDASLLFLTGNYSGIVKGGLRGFDINGNMAVNDFYFIDSSRLIRAAGLKFSYDLRDLALQRTAERLELTGQVSLSELHYNETKFKNLGLRFSMKDGLLHASIRGLYDSTLHVDIDGSAALVDHSYLLTFNRFNLSYLGETWQNASPVRVSVDTGTIAVHEFQLCRNRTTLTVNGTRSFSGENNFNVRIDSVQVGELEFLFSARQEALDGKSFNGLASIEASISGTDEVPMFALDAYTGNLGYQDEEIGELTMEGRYSNRKLELYSELNYSLGTGVSRKVFFVSGSLPMNISFAGEQKPGLTGAANLKILMKDFPLALTEKFIGLFSPLRGTANADINVEGTASEPRLSGYLAIDEANGRFVFNNLNYRMALRLEPDGHRILVKNFSVRNDENEWSAGRITATGQIDMDGFKISNFDMEMHGQLKVLRTASRAIVRSMYGDLFIGTGDEGIHYRGRFDRSTFTGKVRILRGELTFPQTGQASDVSEYSNIRYIEIDDVAKSKNTSLSESRLARSASLFGKQVGRKNADSGEHLSTSILDGLSYSVNVVTEGPLRINMPFSSLSQEELNAKLNIDALRVEKWSGSPKFVGEVTLGAESYYNQFGKRFKATGSLIFTRDPQNPDLNLRGVFSDYHTNKESGDRRKVFVLIKITGTRNKPELAWDMVWDSEDSQSRPVAGDVQSDALSFILLGVFTDELSGSDRGRIADQYSAITNALGSSIASAAATEFISKVGLQDVFKRVEFGGIGTEETRVKVTSEIGRAILTYDGKVRDLGSSDIVIEFPLNMFIPDFGFGNMVVQFSRRTTNNAMETGISTQENSVYEGKILYRFSL